VPRTGLTSDEIVAEAAQLSDEIGYDALTMGLLAERLHMRAPSLYKHVESLADLQHRIATLAMTELGDELRDAMQGKAELEALSAVATPQPSARSSPVRTTRSTSLALVSSNRSLPCFVATGYATTRPTTRSVSCDAPFTASRPCLRRTPFSGTRIPKRASPG
jgi:AcrR family transcriptional regulator